MRLFRGLPATQLKGSEHMNFLKVFMLLVTLLVTFETRSEEPWAEQKLLNLAYTIEGLESFRRLPSETP